MTKPNPTLPVEKIEEKFNAVSCQCPTCGESFEQPLSEEAHQALRDLQAETAENSYKEGAKAGLQEGTERVIGFILEELDMAEQNKESAVDLEDPKIRIKYLRDKLLKTEPIYEN